MSYEKDHVEYDDLGMKSVHCFSCNQIIRKRVEVPSRQDPRRSILTMMTLNTYRERELELSDGSLMYAMFCVNCVNDPIDSPKLMAVVVRGWEKELIQAGRPQVAIDRMKRDKKNLTVTKVNRTLTESGRVGEELAKDMAAQQAEATAKE